MNTNKNLEVNELLIYTIFFNDANILYNNPIYNALNISKDDAKKHMKNIAYLGKGKFMEEESFIGIDNAFQKIANSINPKFGLKLNYK